MYLLRSKSTLVVESLMKQVPLPGTWQRVPHWWETEDGCHKSFFRLKYLWVLVLNFFGNLERQFLCDGGCFRLKDLNRFFN
ncbi:hypothetical protein BDL97_12G056000 [Sphagnum fallax]|nr:hypothetical protein BDL97_12G056000 [Sphagnum fallax]